MSSFFSKLSDKATHALNASPLAGKIPHTGAGQPRPDSPDAANQPAANQAAAQGGQKSHAFGALTHQFRTFQQQYSSATTHAQKIITAEKGLVLDFDNVAREAKAQSKEVYTWGQTEPEDIKDVSDRIAYLNFVSGALAASLAQKLDAARGPFKALRDAETALQPRRAARAALEAQLAKVENDPKKGGDLREQIKRAELEDAQAEREVLILKRKALKESEQQKWIAVQEYAEKLLLLAQAAPPILAELPAYPPTPNSPYNGFQATGAVRAALQQALDHHKPGITSFALPSAGADLSRSDTRSFGETHAQELSNINVPGASTPHPEIQVAQLQGVQQPVPTHVPAPTLAPSFPVPASQPQAPVAAHAPHAANQSPPIDPSHLNQMPAPLPQPKIQSPPVASSPEERVSPTAAPASVITPTIAETGIPVSAGEKGPGPAKGSLHDLKHASTQSGALQSPPSAHPTASNPSPPVVPVVSGGQYPSAEEEKRRLAAQYSTAGRLPESSPLAGPPAASAAGPSVGHAKEAENAEEEKKRLEREERERILHGNSNNQPPRRDGEPDEDLPPYQEPGLQ